MTWQVWSHAMGISERGVHFQCVVTGPPGSIEFDGLKQEALFLLLEKLADHGVRMTFGQGGVALEPTRRDGRDVSGDPPAIAPASSPPAEAPSALPYRSILSSSMPSFGSGLSAGMAEGSLSQGSRSPGRGFREGSKERKSIWSRDASSRGKRGTVTIRTE